MGNSVSDVRAVKRHCSNGPINLEQNLLEFHGESSGLEYGNCGLRFGPGDTNIRKSPDFKARCIGGYCPKHAYLKKHPGLGESHTSSPGRISHFVIPAGLLG